MGCLVLLIDAGPGLQCWGVLTRQPHTDPFSGREAFAVLGSAASWWVTSNVYLCYDQDAEAFSDNPGLAYVCVTCHGHELLAAPVSGLSLKADDPTEVSENTGQDRVTPC